MTGEAVRRFSQSATSPSHKTNHVDSQGIYYRYGIYINQANLFDRGGGGGGGGGIDIYEVTTASLFRMVICVHSAHHDLTLLF